MKRGLVLAVTIGLVIACQIIPTPPPLKATSPSWVIPTEVSQSRPKETGQVQQSPQPPAALGTKVVNLVAPGELPPFPYKASDPFAYIPPVAWNPSATPASQPVLPIQMDQVANLPVAAGLTNDQRAFLSQNGFVAVHSREEQFIDIREQVSTRFGQPYYLTSDAAYHALHANVDWLLKALEQEEFRPRLLKITRAMLQEISSYTPLVIGTSLEAETRQAAAYLSVGLRLLDPQAKVDPDLEKQVSAQVNQILAGGGPEKSVLLPNFQDDYSAYRPSGHYLSNAELENYFRGKTWFERVNFSLQDQSPNFVPSRVPLILTLALRRANVAGRTAAEEWAGVTETLDFLVGRSIDYGPTEYAALMDQIYGPTITILDLENETLWRNFVSLGQVLPKPPDPSIFANSLRDFEGERSWRFLGQRFGQDEFILRNLVYPKVGTLYQPRQLPSGLDMMAALGSPDAMQILEKSGDTVYLNYPEQIAKLQTLVQSQTDSGWSSSAYNIWLDAFSAQATRKSEGYPSTQNTNAWAYKDLNSALGSWAELKHDTYEFVGLPEMARQSEAPASGPAPGYVEPDPPIYYRLSSLVNLLVKGLEQRGLLGGQSEAPDNLVSLLQGMRVLGARYQQLGDIAAKELDGTPLVESDYQLIQAPLGLAEERVWQSRKPTQMGATHPLDMPPVPVISAVEGTGDRISEVGVGLVDRIYAVVPLDGKFYIAQGGIYSYYELSWPRVEQLNDGDWRRLIRYSEVDTPVWEQNFRLSDGTPVNVLAFRVGDVYQVLSAGSGLNVRQSPTRNAKVVQQLQARDYVKIVDGPVHAEGFTWWKFNLISSTDQVVEGWAVENPEWFTRAWGQ